MTTALAPSLTISAPAKINLGLEVLGKRADGFHEIRTLMAMLEFGDRLTLSAAPVSSVAGVAGVDQRSNLISRAIEAFRDTGGMTSEVRVSTTKRIPFATGLGGASADAAATLHALNMLACRPLADTVLRDLAAALGSDVPFFLGSPLALASGTGTDLVPLSPEPFAVLLVVPNMTIPDKTRSLYGLLNASDFSDGSRVSEGLRSLAEGKGAGRQALANAFERPLYERFPDLAALRQGLERLDCLAIGLSGAGPTHYVLPHPDRQLRTASELRAMMPAGTRIIETRTRLVGLHVEKLSPADRSDR